MAEPSTRPSKDDPKVKRHMKELEDEIKKFNVENNRVAKMQKECEQQLKRLNKELEEFETRKVEELEEIQTWRQEQESEMDKDRRHLEDEWI